MIVFHDFYCHQIKPFCLPIGPLFSATLKHFRSFSSLKSYSSSWAESFLSYFRTSGIPILPPSSSFVCYSLVNYSWSVGPMLSEHSDWLPSVLPSARSSSIHYSYTTGKHAPRQGPHELSHKCGRIEFWLPKLRCKLTIYNLQNFSAPIGREQNAFFALTFMTFCDLRDKLMGNICLLRLEAGISKQQNLHIRFKLISWRSKNKRGKRNSVFYKTCFNPALKKWDLGRIFIKGLQKCDAGNFFKGRMMCHSSKATWLFFACSYHSAVLLWCAWVQSCFYTMV